MKTQRQCRSVLCEFSCPPRTTRTLLMVPSPKCGPNSSDLCKTNAGLNVCTKDRQIAHDVDLLSCEESIWPPCTCTWRIPGNPRMSLACRLCSHQGANLSVIPCSNMPLFCLANPLEVVSGLYLGSFWVYHFTTQFFSCPSMSRTCPSADTLDVGVSLSSQALL